MDITGFVTAMAAVSTAVQTLVDHLIKGRSTWLDQVNPDRKSEGRRQSVVHLISFALGALIAYTAGVFPLVALGFSGGLVDAHSKLANSLAAGVLY